MSNAPAVSGEICQYEWSPEVACVPNANPKNTTTVTSGVTNRPGNQVPAANPIAVRAGTPAALTAAGHHSGLPQDACRAVMRYTTATQARQASSAQAVVAAQVASWRDQRGRAVPATRSAMPRRPSRDPIHAAAPVTGITRSSSSRFCRVMARRFHIGGSAMISR